MSNTKAELLAEVRRLHNQSETELSGSVKVFNTVKYELPLLFKDVKNAGSSLRKLLTF
mgnify:CR=1 FL=1